MAFSRCCKLNFVLFIGLCCFRAAVVSPYLLTPTLNPDSANSGVTAPVTWNSWEEWSCHFEADPCLMYKRRNCSNGIDTDCEKLGGKTYDIKPCSDKCNDNTELNSTTVTPTTATYTLPSNVPTTALPSSVEIPQSSVSNGGYSVKLLSTTVDPMATTEHIPVYWLGWSSWKCTNPDPNVCLMEHHRNCSTMDVEDCKVKLGGDSYKVIQCDSTVCPATWSEWGKWSCRMSDHGTCNMTRTRVCSTGTAKDCGTETETAKPCDRNVCPEKVKLQLSGQCREYVSDSQMCSDSSQCDIITDMFHPICSFKDMASKNCPKACGCCDEERHWSEWSLWECKVDPSSRDCEMRRQRNCSSADECEGMSTIVTKCDDTVCTIQIA